MEEAEAQAKAQEARIDLAAGPAALPHVIAAVELYMQAVQQASAPAERSRLRKKCADLMACGEQLKVARGGGSAPAAPAAPAAPLDTAMATLSLSPAAPAPSAGASRPAADRQPPASTRALSKREQIILLKASKLHGSVFPPWEAAPADDAFALASSGHAPFEDDTVFSMSPQQSAILAGWTRLGELVALDADADAAAAQGRDPAMVADAEPDLVQDMTTDCSVVASLCAMTNYASRRAETDAAPPLLASILWPFDHGRGQPRRAENGRYVFRLHFNGAFRRVVVDDHLPSSTSRTLFVVDRRNPLLLWPALLEKAYLKVHGGYDFPGSNSGTDLWVLTGWIPEQVFLQSSDTDLDQVWHRVCKAFARGDVLVTLGTGRLSAAEEAQLGLASQHDYAVLDLQHRPDGGRRLLVKNPWCDNLVWRGAASVPASGATTGTFWIGFDDVVQYYESLYLNWNPSLFRHRQDHHFNWTLPSKAMAHSLAANPQYAVQADADGTVWILLNRHFQDAELDMVRRKRRPSASASASHSHAGFISLYVFAADGTRVLLPDRPRWLHRGLLVDSPQTLVCFEARRGVPYTVVVAQSALPLPSYSFTLSLFSLAPLQVAPAADRLAHQQDVAGAWTWATAGGSPASPDFVHNPQYALTLPRPSPLTLLLCADADHVPVRVDLVWARGQRVAALAVRDLVVSSGEYQRGCALAAVVPRSAELAAAVSPSSPPTTAAAAAAPLHSVSSGNGSGSAGFGPGAVDAGTYTIVVSTFERGQHAPFVLRVGAAVPVALHPIPAEDAGLLRTSLAPLMLAGEDEDGDGLSSPPFRRQAAVVEAPRNARIRLVVQAVEAQQGPRAAGVAGAAGAAGAPTTTHTYAATAAAAAAASTASVRVSVERMAGGSHGRSRGDELVATGDGQFQGMPVAGLRTGEATLGRASPYHHLHHPGAVAAATAAAAPPPWFRIVAEVRGGGSSSAGDAAGRPPVGIRVDVLSSDRIVVHPWQELE